MKRYFIDMDGTLAKWNNVAFEELFEKGYYRNLEPEYEVIRAVKELIKQQNNVYILSSYLTESLWAKDEKQGWLEEYLSEIDEDHYIFVPYGEEKGNYIDNEISAEDILLDDYTVNLNDWTKRGGTAIKYLNGINHTKGTWQGLKTDAKSISEDLDIDFGELNEGLEVKKEGKLPTERIRAMDYRTAEIKAEQTAACYCFDCDVDFEFEKKTSISTRNLISGVSFINDIIRELAHAYKNSEEDLIKEKETELKRTIYEFADEYLDEEDLDL